MHRHSKTQPPLRHLASLAVVLWLFVSVWFPLSHSKSHIPRTETASLALSGADSCALCLLEAQPLCLSALPLIEPCFSALVPEQPAALMPLSYVGALLATTTRGPPSPLS